MQSNFIFVIIISLILPLFLIVNALLHKMPQIIDLFKTRGVSAGDRAMPALSVFWPLDFSNIFFGLCVIVLFTETLYVATSPEHYIALTAGLSAAILWVQNPDDKFAMVINLQSLCYMFFAFGFLVVLICKLLIQINNDKRKMRIYWSSNIYDELQRKLFLTQVETPWYLYVILLSGLMLSLFAVTADEYLVPYGSLSFLIFIICYAFNARFENIRKGAFRDLAPKYLDPVKYKEYHLSTSYRKGVLLSSVTSLLFITFFCAPYYTFSAKGLTKVSFAEKKLIPWVDTESIVMKIDKKDNALTATRPNLSFSLLIKTKTEIIELSDRNNFCVTKNAVEILSLIKRGKNEFSTIMPSEEDRRRIVDRFGVVNITDSRDEFIMKRCIELFDSLAKQGTT